MIYIICKIHCKLQKICNKQWSYLRTFLLFKVNKIRFSDFASYGVPFIHIAKNSHGMQIGKNFKMNNTHIDNPIGFFNKCSFIVHPYSEIKIGNNVGISQSALVSHSLISIGDNVKIGGGCLIYTSDFHSLDYHIRNSKYDQKNKKNAPVKIEENVFIGARSIILKGVTIGRNSIIGAGSVVTKSVPSNQIWAGNPAVFIRNIEEK